MMKKRIRKCLTVTLCAILLFSVAAAEEPVLSDREKAIMLADKAIEEKYGLTLLTREYLSCSVEKEAENAYTVRYGGIEGLDDVLGIYQVAVENGTVTDVSWSYDGEDTSGRLNAMAWGRDQLMTMLRINQETGSMDSIYEYADEISDRRLEADREAMRSLCVLSREQIDTIGASAIRTIYELTEEQASQLVSLYEPEDTEKDYWYVRIDGIPCVMSWYGLGDDEAEKALQPDGIRYREKEGTYWVYIDVQTGAVVEASFSYGIGGNG